MEVKMYDNTFYLSPEKVVFWVEANMLIISDAHFTKESHFRKNGIPVPNGILQHDLLRLTKLIKFTS